MKLEQSFLGFFVPEFVETLKSIYPLILFKVMVTDFKFLLTCVRKPVCDFIPYFLEPMLNTLISVFIYATTPLPSIFA